MEAQSSNSQNDWSGVNMKVGFFELLFLVFLFSKLNNQIDWSWWIVFSPLIFVILVSFIAAIVEELK